MPNRQILFLPVWGLGWVHPSTRRFYVNRKKSIIKINNKMGSPYSKSFKENLVDIKQLTLVKKTSLGKHYKHKPTNQQYLLIQILAETQVDSKQISSLLNERVQERISKKKKNIPKIICFQQKKHQFCSNNSRFFIWMLHAGRSLEEQIREREQMSENFGEGEIWMIFYSCLCAMISYHSLGYSVDLNSSVIFISEKGDVIVSDASSYSSYRRLRQCKFRKQPESNILSLCEIAERMIKTLKGRYKYSEQLYQLIASIKNTSCEGYQKAISITIQLKSSLDNFKKRVSLAENVEHVISQPAQYYPPVEKNVQQIFNNQYQQASNQAQLNAIQKQKMLKQKFYRTTPIQKLANNYSKEFNSTDPLIRCQNYWTQVDYSNISEKMKSSHSEQNMIGLNALWVEMEENNIRELQLKNRAFLQMLIMSEKNMILEVSENSQDLSSARSKLSPTISSSFHTFHMTPVSSLGLHQ